MSFSIRDARKSDLAILTEFIVQEAIEAEGRSPDRELIARSIALALDSDHFPKYWVLENSEAVIGSISVFTEWSDWNAAPYWWVHSIFIAKEFRGRGLMNWLLDHVQAIGKSQGAIELRLYVHTSNQTAIRAYEKSEFKKAPYIMMSRPI